MEAGGRGGRGGNIGSEWESGVELFVYGNYDSAIAAFKEAGDTAKINFNLGVSFAKRGNYRAAIDHFDKAISMDSYMAVAYFTRGTCHFLCYGYEAAAQDFTRSLDLFHTHDRIDYRPLGLPFTLLRADVYYNRGLCAMAMRRFEKAQADMVLARRAYSDKNRRKHVGELLKRIKAAMNEAGIVSQLIEAPVLDDDDLSPTEAQERASKALISKLKSVCKEKGVFVQNYNDSSILDLFIESNVAQKVDAQLSQVLPPYSDCMRGKDHTTSSNLKNANTILTEALNVALPDSDSTVCIVSNLSVSQSESESSSNLGVSVSSTGSGVARTPTILTGVPRNHQGSGQSQGHGHHPHLRHLKSISKTKSKSKSENDLIGHVHLNAHDNGDNNGEGEGEGVGVANLGWSESMVLKELDKFVAETE